MGLIFPIMPTGGVNQLDDPRRIRDDEVVSAKNLVPLSKGMLGKRPASEVIKPITVGNPGRPVLDLAAFPTRELEYLVARPDLLCVVGKSTSAYTKDLFNFDLPPAIVPWRESLYVFTGYGVTNTAPNSLFTGSILSASGFTDFAFAGTGNADLQPKVACLYRKRFVYANFGPGYQNRVVMADSDLPTTIGDSVLAAAGRSFDVGPGDSDEIIAMVEVTQTSVGSPSEGALLILKRNSAHIITGEPHESTYTPVAPDTILGDMKVSKISYNCGCASPQTIVKTPYGVFWASADDVWFFAVGSLPIRVGSKIRPALSKSSIHYHPFWFAVYFNGFYRLSVCIERSNTQIDYTNTIETEQWWLDLRDGPPQTHQDARWWGPQTYKVFANDPTIDPLIEGTSRIILDNRPGQEEMLVGIEPYESRHDVFADGAEMLVGYDVKNQRDMQDYRSIAVSDVYPAFTHDYHSTEIDIELVTKEYDFGDLFNQKGLIKIQADYANSVTDYLRADIIVDGGKTIDQDVLGLCEQAGFLLDADATETGLVSRVFQEAAIYPSTRLAGKTFQFRISDQAGYVIGAYNDLLVVLRAGTYYEVSLTQGYYANLKDLLDHIVARCVTVVGVTCTHDVVGPNSRAATITLTFGSAVTLCFASAGGDVTAADLRESRALMGMLGWDTSANSASATTQASTTNVYYRQLALWEFGGFSVEIDFFRRGPA